MSSPDDKPALTQLTLKAVPWDPSGFYSRVLLARYLRFAGISTPGAEEEAHRTGRLCDYVPVSTSAQEDEKKGDRPGVRLRESLVG